MPLALKGYDPILLAAGKEVAGLPGLTSTYHKFSYRFATAANKGIFDGAPADHAVQLDGACVHMSRMKGDPNLWLVHEGKIYLAGNEMCLAGAKSDPTAYVEAARDAIKNTKVVAVFVFNGVEDIDYAGPVEVLNGAGYKIVSVTAKEGTVKTVANFELTPDYTFDDLPDIDVLVLPGGSVPRTGITDPKMVAWLNKTAKTTPHILSVCNGAFWLAGAGLLDGKEATTTYGNLPNLAQFKGITVRGDLRFTDNGQIVTSAGLSAGIDGALHLLEKMDGPDTAKAVALGIEYNWQPTGGFVRGALADRHLQWLRQGAVKGVTWNGMVRQDGDKDKWNVTWDVETTTISAPELKKAFASAATGRHWKGVSSASEDETFEFTDSDGIGWQAVVKLRSVGGAMTRLTIDLHKKATIALGH